jgi:beta-glucosidase
VITSTWQDKAAAILECWLSGQAAGGAAADLLLGTVNPSGKLAETIPVRLQDSTSYLNFPGDSGSVRYGEGIFIGYRGYDATDLEVSYPFGFGLSYTTFEISDLEVSQQGSVEGGDLAVEAAVTVTNTGQTAGAEVVQVYVRDIESSVARPIRELKGFAKVWLQPGESQRVTIGLDERSFAFWSIRLGRWVVEGGEFEIAVGSSSRDLAVSQTITIDAPSIAPRLDADSTLQEWLADIVGGRLLSGLGVPMFDDPERVKAVGTMPLRTLANFGRGLVHDKLDELVAELRASEGK